jgi:hypothetical protein
MMKLLAAMGFVMDSMQCLLTKGEVGIFDFVGDFLVCEQINESVSKVVAKYIEVATTTEPIWDRESILGHYVIWLSLGRVALSIKKKINQLVQQHGGDHTCS